MANKFSPLDSATVSVHGLSGYIGTIQIRTYTGINEIKKIARLYSCFAVEICVVQFGGFCKWYKL